MGCRWRWARGTGSEMRRPLGITIVGGLIVSQALTLFTTPVVYLFFDRVRGRFARMGQTADGAGCGAGCGWGLGCSLYCRDLLLTLSDRFEVG